MIIHIERREDPYVRIDKKVINDSNLSWAARGVLAFLLSKPPEWEVRMGHLISCSSEGETAVRSVMRELREFGYAEIKNTSAGATWIIREEPLAENPHAALADSAQSSPNKNEGKIVKNDNRKNMSDGSQGSPPDEVIELELNPSKPKGESGNSLQRKGNTIPAAPRIKSKPNSIDIQAHNLSLAIKQEWNAMGLPKIIDMSARRKSAIKTMIRDREGFAEDWKMAILYASRSDFLMGRTTSKSSNHANWKINIDWFLVPANFIKILEGKYKGTDEDQAPTVTYHM